MNVFYAPLEVKFTEAGAPVGLFSGYGAVFHNQDSHGDVIKPGAFTESIAESKASGRPVPDALDAQDLWRRWLAGGCLDQS